MKNTIEIRQKQGNALGIYGIGVNDVVGATTIHKKPYKLWKGMIERCYSEKEQLRKPTYIGCSVVEEWLTFSNYLEWYYDNVIEGYQVDKDLLGGAVKQYGPNTCCFLPKAINSALTNNQSNNKSGYIGCCWNKRAKKWCANITKHGVSHFIGGFDSVEEGAKAYRAERDLYLKELADTYKDTITEQAYNRLYEGGL